MGMLYMIRVLWALFDGPLPEPEKPKPKIKEEKAVSKPALKREKAVKKNIK